MDGQSAETCTLGDAMKVMILIERIRSSSNKGQMVTI